MMVNNPKMTEASIVETLESLPASIQSLPGTVVTLALLHDTASSSSSSTSKGESILKSLGDGIQAKLAMAEYQMMSKGNYKAAVELLTGIVEEDGNLEATAMLVKALSYTDPSKAEDYVGVLHDAVAEGNNNGPEMDGEALESMDIPRFAKLSGVSGSTASGGEGGSNKVRKMIAATGGKGRSTMGDRSKKKNREAILRKRTKQREAYLVRLESEGRYTPNKTPLTKPDPERWIPKSQRSYNRRGRGRGRGGGNVGAQGGGAGAGMEKEAAKLDVAARVAAAKAGGGTGSGDSKPSTANIKVSSSGQGRKGKGGRRR